MTDRIVNRGMATFRSISKKITRTMDVYDQVSRTQPRDGIKVGFQGDSEGKIMALLLENLI